MGPFCLYNEVKYSAIAVNIAQHMKALFSKTFTPEIGA